MNLTRLVHAVGIVGGGGRLKYAERPGFIGLDSNPFHGCWQSGFFQLYESKASSQVNAAHIFVLDLDCSTERPVDAVCP